MNIKQEDGMTALQKRADDWREYAESLRVHPVAAMFPMIEGKHYEDLCASIESIGLIEPVVLMDDCLVDGRNRIKACLDLDIEPTYVQYRKLDCGEEPVALYIEARNLARRDLTDDQRVSIAAKLEAEGYIKRANMKRSMAAASQAASQSRASDGKMMAVADSPGVNQTVKTRSEPQPSVPTAVKVAKKAGVSQRKGQQALKAAVHAPEALEQVIAGKLPLADAAKIAEKVSPPKPRKSRKDPATISVDDRVKKVMALIKKTYKELPTTDRNHFITEVIAAIDSTY